MFNFLEVLQPLEQFTIRPLLSLCLSKIYDFLSMTFSNFLIYSSIAVFVIWLILFIALRYLQVVRLPIWQAFLENVCLFFMDLVGSQLGQEGQRHIIAFFSAFLFILIANLVGLLPYSFTITSHILQTFTFSVACFLGITIFGVIFQKWKFLNLFIPKGVPFVFVPFISIIEVISYLSRAFSLGIRLFANMMAGHSLLNILSVFGVSLYKKDWFADKIFAFIPFIIVICISFLEIVIAFLQAYVFVVLLCIYLKDSFHASH